MKVILEPEAEEDLRSFEKQHQEYIRDRLKELEERPTGHPDSDTIRVKGREVFKYVIKKGNKGGKDYRAVYDIRNNKIKVLALLDRDSGYDKEEIESRL